MTSFTVCALFYGDHPELATRLLASLASAESPQSHVREYRFGLNAVCERTRTLVEEFSASRNLPTLVYEPERNVGKYPLMRLMFHGRPTVGTSHVMWFDDDSALARPLPRGWHERVAQVAMRATVVGEIWFREMLGAQPAAIKTQPWYRGREFMIRRSRRTKRPAPHFKFVTGGWWTADFAFLRQWDYPFPDLFHNGGDAMLGELVRQQEPPASLHHFNEGVFVNKDDQGRRAPRRGVGKTGERLLWTDWSPDAKVDPSLLEFACRIARHGPDQNLSIPAENA